MLPLNSSFANNIKFCYKNLSIFFQSEFSEQSTSIVSRPHYNSRHVVLENNIGIVSEISVIISHICCVFCITEYFCRAYLVCSNIQKFKCVIVSTLGSRSEGCGFESLLYLILQGNGVKAMPGPILEKGDSEL